MLLLLNGAVILHVVLADTPETRVQGLRDRLYLAPGAGMLFAWPEPQPIEMTMRETSIPLDIAFVNDGRINSIVTAPAHSWATISGWGSHVIEASAGFFASNGIAVGASVTAFP